MARNKFARLQIVLLSGMLVGLFVAGLRPFNFFPENDVQWLADENGVRFEGYGQIYGPSPFAAGSAAGQAHSFAEFTIELWMASRTDSQSEVTDILALYRSRDEEPFAIEQWRQGLVLGGRFRDREGRPSSQHIGVGRVLAGGTRRFVTVTTSGEGTAIYVDGALAVQNPALMLGRENMRGSLLLGQTGRGAQEWHGEILGLAMYPRALSASEVASNYSLWKQGDWAALRAQNPGATVYTFDEHRGTVVHALAGAGSSLAMPAGFRAIDPVVLETPSREDLTNVSDVALNILGFIPFGALLVVYWKSARNWPSGKSLVAAILAGFAVSLLIELLQVFLPSRDSSLLDLINNMLGTAIGAGLGVTAYPWLRRVLFSRG